MVLLSVSMTALQFMEQLMFWKDGPLELIEDVELNVEVIEELILVWSSPRRLVLVVVELELMLELWLTVTLLILSRLFASQSKCSISESELSWTFQDFVHSSKRWPKSNWTCELCKIISGSCYRHRLSLTPCQCCFWLESCANFLLPLPGNTNTDTSFLGNQNMDLLLPGSWAITRAKLVFINMVIGESALVISSSRTLTGRG